MFCECGDCRPTHPRFVRRGASPKACESSQRVERVGAVLRVRRLPQEILTRDFRRELSSECRECCEIPPRHVRHGKQETEGVELSFECGDCRPKHPRFVRQGAPPKARGFSKRIQRVGVWILGSGDEVLSSGDCNTLLRKTRQLCGSGTSFNSMLQEHCSG